jgi:hypothetical protein
MQNAGFHASSGAKSLFIMADSRFLPLQKQVPLLMMCRAAELFKKNTKSPHAFYEKRVSVQTFSN